MTSEVQVKNPIIPLDYPDVDVIRVDDTYYMISTTMYFMPGCEILRSYDLVNWEHATYVYDRLDSTPAQRLEDDLHIYGQGMWAASLRYHNGTFYVVFAANDTRKTYLFTANEIEGPWEKSEIEGFYHDASLFFDDDNRTYLIYGNREVWITELESDLSKRKKNGRHQILVSESEQDNPNLSYEGAHFYKINGTYYLFLIRSLPDRWMRVQSCFIANSLDETFIGKDVLVDDRDYCGQGVAQGGIVDTPAGDWYAILFQDSGAVGRMPILVPVEWHDGDFPIFGDGGKIPEYFHTESTRPEYSYEPLVGSDGFKKSYPKYFGLAPRWQFNHEPDLTGFSVNTDEGYVELTTTKVTDELLHASNTLTQRMQFPNSSAEVTVDATNLNDGDIAGFCALQGSYGFVGITKESGNYYLVVRTKPVTDLTMQTFEPNNTEEKEWERLPLDNPKVTLKIVADFWQMKDIVRFYYQQDGQFTQIGPDHQVAFKLDHFTGCRFGLFCYSTKKEGGSARFSRFKYNS